MVSNSPSPDPSTPTAPASGGYTEEKDRAGKLFLEIVLTSSAFCSLYLVTF